MGMLFHGAYVTCQIWCLAALVLLARQEVAEFIAFLRLLEVLPFEVYLGGLLRSLFRHSFDSRALSRKSKAM